MDIDLLLTSTIDNYQPNFSSGNLLNYARVNSLSKDPQTQQLNGLTYVDKLSNKTHTVNAKCVVNCAGAFADSIRTMDDPKASQRIIAVSGSHVTLPQKFSSKKHALVIPETEDGRILFLVPWLQHTIIGTTEKQLEGPILNPTVQPDELIFMETEVSKIYPKIPISAITNSIESKWSGVRPLILEQQKEGEPIDTKKLARKHVIETSKSGLVSLMGGKWTVYRLMGEETVD